jgi:hypothetical protein
LIDDNCIHLHVRIRARAVYVVVGILFLTSIHHCVGEFAKGIKTRTFAHPKEPHLEQARIAA